MKFPLGWRLLEDKGRRHVEYLDTTARVSVEYKMFLCHLMFVYIPTLGFIKINVNNYVSSNMLDSFILFRIFSECKNVALILSHKPKYKILFDAI